MNELGKILVGFILFGIVVSAILEIAPNIGSFRQSSGQVFDRKLAEKTVEVSTFSNLEPTTVPTENLPTPTLSSIGISATPTVESVILTTPTPTAQPTEIIEQDNSGCIERMDRSELGGKVTYGHKQAQKDGLTHSYGIGGDGTALSPYQAIIYTNCKQ